MNKALLLAVKDWRVLLSDKGNIFWVFGFPVLFALFFGAIFSAIMGLVVHCPFAGNLPAAI